MAAHRTAIVTGGGRGIGKGISLGLAAKGLTVAVVYHRREAEATQVVKAIHKQGGQARSYPVNVTKREQVLNLVRQVLNDFGTLDVLVNNAGEASRACSVDLKETEWDRILAVNLTGAFYCSQAVIEPMRLQKRGRIVNISSIAGQTGGSIGPHYAASKAGLIGLTRYMARELGPDGITVNAIAPSGIPTELLEAMGFSNFNKRPVGRAGKLEDVAAAVCYLTSLEADYITGQVLGVNGGSFIG
jgi:3-oxoacyl-[acyl-carrier protein] reductase